MEQEAYNWSASQICLADSQAVPAPENMYPGNLLLDLHCESFVKAPRAMRSLGQRLVADGCEVNLQLKQTTSTTDKVMEFQ